METRQASATVILERKAIQVNAGLKSGPVAVARLRPAGPTCPLIG